MSTIKVLVNEQSLRVINGPKIASRGVNENVVEFTFDESWDGFGKTAIFYKEFHEENVYQSIIDSDGIASVPHEVTDTECKMCFGVVGTNGNIIYTTEVIKYNIVKGVPISGSESEPPSPTIYQQMLSLVGQVQSDVDSFESDTNDRLDVMSSQMDEFIAEHAGTYGKTILWDSDNTSGETISGNTQTVTLAEDCSEYDYIDIYFGDYVRTNTGADFVGNSQEFFEPDYNNKQVDLLKWQFSPASESDPDGIHFKITYHDTSWSWSGNAIDDAVSLGVSRVGWPFDKIVGRKLVADAELVDARVGVDGTVYQTVGAAIRSQINDVAGGTVELDTTLTQQGKAADAKAVGDKISEVKADLALEEFPSLSYDIAENNKYISSNGGTGNNNSYSVTDYIDISNYERIYYKKGQVTVSSVCYIAIYHADKTFSRSIRWVSNASYRGYAEGLSFFTVGGNEKYARFTVFSDTETYGNFEVFGNGYPLYNAFNAINTDIPFNTCMSMYNSFGVCGASWDCGYFIVNGSSYRKPSLSWGANLAKRNGNTCKIFAYQGLRTDTWLASNYGLSQLLSEQPQDLYILTFGGNDSAQGANWLGTIEDITSHSSYEDYSNSFYGNYGKIIEQIKEHAPNCKMIMIMHYNSNYQSENRGAYYNATVNIANHYNIPHLNWSDDKWYDSDYVRNGLVNDHPTPVIYAGISQSWERLYSKCVKQNYNYFKDFGT